MAAVRPLGRTAHLHRHEPGHRIPDIPIPHARHHHRSLDDRRRHYLLRDQPDSGRTSHRRAGWSPMIARQYSAAQIPRRIRLAALLAVGGLTLAACGAQVSSELEVSDDQSGTRTNVASIAEEEIEELSGGIEAAEAALEAHLPDELNFAGISQTDSDEEEAAGETDSYLAEFELAFSDLDDYQTKAQALLDLAVEKEEAIRDSSEPDVDHTPVQVDFVDNDGPLLDGFILEENFTGSDPLDCTSYALVEDGVVDEENANSIIGSAGDESRVLFNGDEYEASEPFSISEGEDQRFSDVDEIGRAHV